MRNIFLWKYKRDLSANKKRP